jgi:hypothetical protein
MALTKPFSPARYGNSRGRRFAYPVAPGETIWAGGMVCVNSSGQLVRPQTSGAAAFVGIAQSSLSNAGNSAASTQYVEAWCDEFYYAVPSATAANINAPVYATDDNTLTLSAPGSGFEARVGSLIGFDNGNAVVDFRGY